MINILMVDDEWDIDFLMKQRYRQAIKENRLNFLFARNGEEAIKILESYPNIDIMVTDINMPVMNRIDLLDKIEGLYPKLKKFALSAYSDPDNIRLAQKSGVDDFIIKPIKFTDFERKLDIIQ